MAESVHDNSDSNLNLLESLGLKLWESVTQIVSRDPDDDTAINAVIDSFRDEAIRAGIDEDTIQGYLSQFLIDFAEQE